MRRAENKEGESYESGISLRQGIQYCGNHPVQSAQMVAALICAAVCAAVLGGYKYKSLKPFIEQSVYENVKQVTATLYVADYSTSASTERANNVIKMAQSYRAYELVQQKTGCDLDYKTYQGIFDVLQGEAGYDLSAVSD